MHDENETRQRRQPEFDALGARQHVFVKAQDGVHAYWVLLTQTILRASRARSPASRYRGGRSRPAIGCGRRPDRRAPAPRARSCRAPTLEHASAIGEDALAVGFGAGMENLHALDLRRLVQAFDDGALAVGAGITLGRHHHREGCVADTSADRNSSIARRAPRSAPAPDPTSAAASAPGISGSPKRTLYSISCGPFLVIIRPANSTPL